MNIDAKRLGILISFICLFAPAAALGSEAYIPHVTGNGGFWKTILQVDNNGATEASFTITLYDAGRQVDESEFSVAGLGRSVIYLRDLAAVENGSGQVTSTSALLDFRLNYESIPSGGLAEFLLNDGKYENLGFYFTDYTSSIVWKAIVVNNPNDIPANVTLYAVGSSRILGTVSLALEAHSKTDGLYTKWFPGVAFGEIKRIIAASDAPLTGVAISGNADNSLLLFTPGRESQPLNP